MMPNNRLLCGVSVAIVVAGAVALMAQQPTSTPAGSNELRLPATAPADAPKTMLTRDGFTMDLIAAEPLLTDPVAMAYDENGRAWVVEMNDYPYADKKNDRPYQDHSHDPPLGRVRILEDTDGDGRFDKSHVLAEELSWASGIALYDGGAFVAATPDLWYVKDTNGDGRADIRRKVFTGFRKLNVQAIINNLQWGLDNRIYGAGASNGGVIENLAASSGGKGAKPATLARNDFAFDPRQLEIGLLSGGARFGNAFDDDGNRFICNIRNPAQHVVLPARYLARNPYLPLASAVQDVAAGGDTVKVYRRSPPEPWRVINAERLAAAGNVRTPRSESAAVGYVTSAAGVTVYRGTAYPPQYYGNLFIGEVAGNLIHREILAPVGPTFVSHRAPREQEVEFVASTDNWFRPVNFINAPDGTLHVLDMYRETIEHPWSIPDDLKDQLDLRSGADRGRLYRLSPPGFKAPPPPKLGKARVAELVDQLANPNSWWRETAQRLLFERQDMTAVPLLRQLLQESSSPLARLHALYTLVGLNALERDDLVRTLKDPAPGVREHAVRLAEPRLRNDPRLLEKVLTLTDDESACVRFQVALSLGGVEAPGVAEALVDIMQIDMGDVWIRSAVLSSRPAMAGTLLTELWDDAAWRRHPAAAAVARDLAFVVGAMRDESHAREFLAMLGKVELSGDQQTLRIAALVGLGQGAKRSRVALTTWTKESGAQQAVSETLAAAAALARNAQASAETRELALAALALAPLAEYRDVYAELLGSRQTAAVQLAAVKTLAGFDSPEVPPLLMANWASYTPTMRSEIVEALLTRPGFLDPLLSAIESGGVPRSYVSAPRQKLLREHKDPAVRSRAEKLFDAARAGGRQPIIAKYEPALKLSGDATRGLTVYQRECAQCHRWRERGFDVGPNLATIQHRSPSELLVAMLDPNREVGPNFVQYIAQLDDGRAVTGLIASETPTSITLKRQENQQETVLRQDIDELGSTGASLMPEGLENKLTPQDVADVIALLRGR
ncbi:MAG: c-type cytochrome [Planctomycetes bacterium]|nr:c-type cytochrome [Planctomycetota bacterium]